MITVCIYQAALCYCNKCSLVNIGMRMLHHHHLHRNLSELKGSTSSSRFLNDMEGVKRQNDGENVQGKGDSCLTWTDDKSDAGSSHG